MSHLQARVDRNNRIRKSLWWRIRYYIPKALRGEDTFPDNGIQRVGSEGRIHTLAKLPIALWVPTDDLGIAVAELGHHLEQAFSHIDWASDPKTGSGTADLIKSRFGSGE